MVTYPALRAVQPNQFADAAGMIRTLAESVASRADALSIAIDVLDSGWTGAAAAAARGRLTTLRAALYGAYPGLVGIDQALTEFAVTLAAAQAAVVAAAEPEPGSIVQVSPDGTVAITPRFRAPDSTDYADLAAVTDAIVTAVRAAGNADAEVRDRLSAIRLTIDRDQDPPAVTPVGPDPQSIAAWWHGLAAAQQAYLVAVEPSIVANLDGVPADARDQASRMLLHLQAATLTQQDRALRSGYRTAASTAEIATIDGELRGLATLDDRVTDPYSVRAYLLGLDAGNNRAIVSISDPDRAANTLTFVAGVNSGLATVSSTLDPIDNLQQAGTHLPRSDTRAPGDAGSLATIGWIDYAAPATVAQAARITPAQAAAGSLATFEAGLRAGSTRPHPHESILGYSYSYGSVVVGVAARRYRLADDDIIVVASPGTTAGHASDLGIDPGHVWATTARYDPIRFAVKPGAIAAQMVGIHPRDGWLGRNPVDPSFGARVFTSDPGSPLRPGKAHISYFDEETPSLRNIASIAIGDGDDAY